MVMLFSVYIVYHLLVDDVLQMQLYHRLELRASKLAEPGSQ
jgi:hypothetical protein